MEDGGGCEVTVTPSQPSCKNIEPYISLQSSSQGVMIHHATALMHDDETTEQVKKKIQDRARTSGQSRRSI
jgi:hypothetical protein